MPLPWIYLQEWIVQQFFLRLHRAGGQQQCYNIDNYSIIYGYKLCPRWLHWFECTHAICFQSMLHNRLCLGSRTYSRFHFTLNISVFRGLFPSLVKYSSHAIRAYGMIQVTWNPLYLQARYCMPAGIIVVVTKTRNGTEFARNILCTQNAQCLYGVVRTNWSIDTMQQHSKEAAELLYMISPLLT